MSSTKQIGHEYRVKTMMLLAKLGYASTRQIARAVWGGCDTSSRKMAGRTLRYLAKQGWIVTKRDGGSVSGEQLAALTRTGVLQLRGLMPLPGNKAHARDWLRHAHSHRTSANSVYVATASIDIHAGLTELEIRSGEAPPELASYRFTIDGQLEHKIPDVLIELDDGTWEWVEVENGWRSSKDLAKLVAFLRAMFSQRNPAISILSLVITAPGAASIGERLRTALTHGPESGYPRQVQELDARILAERVKVYRLDNEMLELRRVQL